MKAILVEHKFAIPEELQPKAKAIVETNDAINLGVSEASFTDLGIANTAFKELKTNTYYLLTAAVGASYSDYPVWNISKSGEELTGYRYGFQEEE